VRHNRIQRDPAYTGNRAVTCENTRQTRAPGLTWGFAWQVLGSNQGRL